MPRINFCHEFVHPFYFHIDGKNYHLGRREKVVAIASAVAVGIFSICFLGIPGYVVLNMITFRFKKKIINNLNLDINKVIYKGRVEKSNAYFNEVSSQNLEEIVGAIDMIEGLDISTLEKKEFSQIEVNRTLHLARYFLRYDEGRAMLNAADHLKVLECVIRIAQKQKKLLEFVSNYPIENRRHLTMTGYQNAVIVNQFLAREVGIIFHHDEQDVAPMLKDAPITYAKSFLSVWKKGRVADFVSKVFMPTKWACMEGNFKSLIDWEHDLGCIPDVNFETQHLYQVFGAFFSAFREIKLRDYLKQYPDKQRLSKERLLNSPDFNKLLKKEDFIAYMEDKDMRFLPFEVAKVDKGEKIRVDNTNIREVIDEVNDKLGIFNDEEDDKEITAILQRFRNN